jgi:eukaryotic-like serine/threonine-protein kinase
MLRALSSAHEPGAVVDGRYRLIEEIGRGGVGVVWRAARMAGGGEVAIKILSHEVDGSALRTRFVNEARAAAAIDHPQVVRIEEAGEDDGQPFIVMELLPGEDLRARLQRGPLSPSETWHVVSRVGAALTAAHAHSVVHRDLKPANIFLVKRDVGLPSVKVLDYGVAKLSADMLAGATPQTRTGDQLGTPAYMSPEQLRSSKSVDHRADLWAMAVVTFHCLLGRAPFEAKQFGALVLAICMQPVPVPSTLGAVPAGFDAWFARATQRPPEDRFGTCEEMTSALGKVLGA